MRNDMTSNILWCFAGVCTGTAIGLLVAPNSGADTRRLLLSKAGEAGENVAESGREYLDRGRELYDMGCKLAGDAAELFEEGRRLMEEGDVRS